MKQRIYESEGLSEHLDAKYQKLILSIGQIRAVAYQKLTKDDEPIPHFYDIVSAWLIGVPANQVTEFQMRFVGGIGSKKITQANLSTIPYTIENV